MASSDLIWTLVRNNSCFLKKQANMPVLTSEPNNLTGMNTFKFSGLANAKTVGITAAADGKGIVLTKKVTKSERARKVRFSSPFQPPPHPLHKDEQFSS